MIVHVHINVYTCMYTVHVYMYSYNELPNKVYRVYFRILLQRGQVLHVQMLGGGGGGGGDKYN